MFQTLDAKWRIYRKIGNLQLLHTPWVPGNPTSVARRQGPVSEERHLARGQQQMVDGALAHLMATYCPPTLLVSDQLEVLHIIGDMSPYLKKLFGVPSFSVIPLLHDDLRLPVRTLLQRLGRESDDVTYPHVPVQSAEGRQYVTIRGCRQFANVGGGESAHLVF